MNVKGMDIKELCVEAIILGVDTYQLLPTVVGGPHNTEAFTYKTLNCPTTLLCVTTLSLGLS